MMADGLYNEATKKYWISYNEDFQLKTDLPYILHWADNMSTRQENSEYRVKNGMMTYYKDYMNSATES